MDHVLAIDGGTTGVTVQLIDAAGRVVRKADRDFTQHYPKPGWVEHDADEIADVALSLVRRVAAGIPAARLAGIGITNQRETTVLWDRATGRPLHRAIVWQDRRTADICTGLRKRGLESTVRSRTGLTLDPYFSGTKIAWILDHVPGLRRRAERGEVAFGTIDTWLLSVLSGGTAHATDLTNASRTLLFDIHRRRWDPDLLRALRVPASVLPEVKRSAARFGTTAPGVLPGGCVAVTGIAGDQQSALFGQGCVRPGEAKNTYGTGCFLVLNTGDKAVRSRSGLLTTLACDAKGGPVYALEGSVFVAGAAVQWLRDGLGLIRTAAETEKLALSVRDAGGVHLVPAFVGLGAPHWRPDARGILCGLTRGTTRAHLVRATLESIAFQTADVVRAMESDTGRRMVGLKVDGGATANRFLMQFQSDLLGIPVARPANIESTILGAAYLAGIGAGLWKDRGEIEKKIAKGVAFRPRMSAGERACRMEGWRKAVERTLL